MSVPEEVFPAPFVPPFGVPLGEFVPTPMLEEQAQSRFARLYHGVGKAWLNNCIRTSLVVDTSLGEYNENQQDAGFRERWSNRRTVAVTVGGQAYERFRFPEVVGVGLTSNAYRIALEHGWNPGAATAAAAGILGVAVFFQQKIIGRNFVRAIGTFPETTTSINELWPKTQQVAKDATPDPEHRFAEGMGMFGLGTTPFIFSAKLADPSISQEELKAVESRITRRGSVFASGVAGLILGAKSLAPHLPETVKGFALREDAVNWSTNAVDVVSNPYLLSGGFVAWAGLKAAARSIRAHRSQETA